MNDKPWEVKAPHASVGLPASEAGAALSSVLAKVPGVRQRGAGWILPWNAVEVFAELCEKYQVQPVYVKWLTPVPKQSSWTDVEAALRLKGEVKAAAVLDGFLLSYQKDVISFGWNRDGVHIWHATGCLTGDAEIIINRGGEARRITLRDLAHKFHGGESGRFGKGFRWNTDVPVRTASEEGGYLHLNRIEDVFSTGMKEVFAVTTATGLNLRATKDHRFLLPDGSYERLENLSVGDSVCVRGKKSRLAKKRKNLYKLIGVRYHPYAQVTRYKLNALARLRQRRKEGAETLVYRVPYHRLVAEAHRNSIETDVFVKRCQSGKIEGLEFLDPAVWAVHHKNSDHLDNCIENLEVLSHELHTQLHREGDASVGLYNTQADVITSIEPCGIEETFDMTMEAPRNNYVANGFIVHNSGKSISGVLCCLSADGPLIIVTRAASRLQFCREVETYTHLTPYIIKPEGANKGIMKVGGQTWLEFFKAKMPELRKASLVAQAWEKAKAETEVVIEKRNTLDEYLLSHRTARKRPVIIVGWEALPNHLEKLKALRPGAVLYDECFPGTTPVQTLEGSRPIASIQPGDIVLSWNIKTAQYEWKRVLRRIEVPSRGREMMRIKSGSTELICTANHKIWTAEADYVEAGKLTTDHHLRVMRSPGGSTEALWATGTPVLFSRMQWESHSSTTHQEGGKDVHVVSNRDFYGSSSLEAQILQHIVLSKVENESTTRKAGLYSRGQGSSSVAGWSTSVESPGCYSGFTGENAEAEPYVGQPNESQSACDTAFYGTQTSCAWWEWTWHDFSRVYAGSENGLEASRRASEERGSRPLQPETSEALQDRFSRSDTDVSSRDRRGLSWITCAEGTGCEERSYSAYSRVDCVEILESSSGSELGDDSSPDQFLYDLEVEDNHNYFANSVLVSNCHKGKNSSRWSVVPLSDAMGDTDRDKLVFRQQQEEEARAHGGFVKDTEEGPRMFLPVMNMASAAAQLARVARKRVATTATPVKDRVRDLWSQLDMIEPNAWGSKVIFETRHCDRKPGTYGGFDTTGSSNLTELKLRLNRVAHIVPYQETHKSLPPKRRQSLYIAPEDQCEPATGFSRARAEAKKRGASATLELSLMEAATRKRTAVASIIEDHIGSGQKILLFSGRRKDCEDLGKSIKNLGIVKRDSVDVWVVHGEQSQEVRDEVAQMYMAHPGPCVLVSTWQALGESINLQDTDSLFFVMLPPTPGALRQGEGRVARHKQKRPVMIYYVIAEGTVDEHMAAILIDKLPAVERVIDDTELAEAAIPLAGIDPNESDEDFAKSILADLDWG